MTTEELDKALMMQFTVESMMQGAGKSFQPELSEDIEIASLQEQATDFCTKSKGFLCSHHVSMDSQDAIFAEAMKTHINKYRKNASNRNNQFMKWLYNSDVDILCQQIGMLATHTQFKEVEDIHNVSREVSFHSFNPESVTVAISLYVYYTLLENTYTDALSYNELFVKSWYNYYEHLPARIVMFRMNGNNWKSQFKGVLME